jgi:hypothetical protein
VTRDKFKAKAEEYEKLADAAVDPAEKEKAQGPGEHRAQSVCQQP